MKIIFAGTVGRSGLGGQAWVALQYLIGLRELGHDVFYLEDCGESSWVFDWEKAQWTFDLDYPAAYVGACLGAFGFGERWLYRTNKESRGLPLDQFQDICASADLLVMRAVPLWDWRPDYDLPRRRAFIDVDPGFTQISIANGDRGFVEGVARAERRFTIGRHLGDRTCPLPTAGGPWLKTVPTVALSEWPFSETPATHFTTVMRWRGFREARYASVAFGQRDQEFGDYLNLPRYTSQPLLLALMGVQPEHLTAHGWGVAPGEEVSKTPASYRGFIQSSRAEFCVPKHGYVRSRCGWFSDRSVCYLASGRPVLVEDTGLNDWLPVGEGLLTFHSSAGALTGIERINAGYDHHRQAARRLAEEYFSTDKVLPAFLDAAMS